MRLWQNSKERIVLLSLLTILCLCAICIALHAGAVAFFVFLFGWPILLGIWPTLERKVRTRYAMHRYEQGVIATPSTAYYTPPQQTMQEPQPKQEHPSRYEEPMSMY